jgi:hypothetical protein
VYFRNLPKMASSIDKLEKNINTQSKD